MKPYAAALVLLMLCLSSAYAQKPAFSPNLQPASYNAAGSWSGNPGGPFDPLVQDAPRGHGAVVLDLGNNLVVVYLFVFERSNSGDEVTARLVPYLSTPCDLSGLKCVVDWRPVVVTMEFEDAGEPNSDNQVATPRQDLAAPGSIEIVEILCNGSSPPNVCASPRPQTEVVSVLRFDVGGSIYRMSENF